MSVVLIDTGPLVALMSPKDQYHEKACALAKTVVSPFFTTWPVITEALWLLRSSSTARSSLFHAFNVGILELTDLDQKDLQWIGAFMKKYKQIKVQCADASLCCLAEKSPNVRVFTFDYRDFLLFRIRGNKQVRLLED